MSRPGMLVVYVTSHGFGHLNRSVAVVNRVSNDVPMMVRCHPDLFAHWRERLRRPADLGAHISDAGAVNPPGDSRSTDGPATLEQAARIHAEAVGRVDDEADWLRDVGASAVLSDVPPLPLAAARRAGVPGYLLANFTWADVYAPHARRLGGDAPRLVADLRRAYRQATAVFRTEPALSLGWCRNRIEVGMVVAPGVDRRDELRRVADIPAGRKIVYFYIGRYGQTSLGWERLARLGERGVHFVGFHEAPVGRLPNLHVVSPDDWTGADLAASADAIVAKAGYGTTCEAMVAGVPMIYAPRTGFAEYRALDRALRAWGGGVPASTRAFNELRLEPLLDRAFSLRPGPPPFAADGAERVARHLTEVCRTGARQSG